MEALKCALPAVEEMRLGYCLHNKVALKSKQKTHVLDIQYLATFFSAGGYTNFRISAIFRLFFLMPVFQRQTPKVEDYQRST